MKLIISTLKSACLTLALVSAVVLSANSAKAHMLDFEVRGISHNWDGSRTLFVDILDLGAFGPNWHLLNLYIDGIPYPINGWNMIGSNGAIVRAWFYVPTYYGPHRLQLQAVYPITYPMPCHFGPGCVGPYYPGNYGFNWGYWSWSKIYYF